MRHVNLLALLGFVAVAFLLSACESQSPPPHSGPMTAADVKIYKDAPSQKYDSLGLVTVPIGGDVRWDNNGDANVGFQMFKEQVAKMGGNGLLLVVDENAYDAKVLAGDHGTFYQVPIRNTPKTAVAQAIRVKD